MVNITKDKIQTTSTILKSTPASTRYRFGSVRVKHRGVKTETTVGSIRYEELLLKIPEKLSYKVGVIPLEYEHRPEAISELFYNTPGYWWYLMQVNNVSDPFEGFKAGDRIIIPEIEL